MEITKNCKGCMMISETKHPYSCSFLETKIFIEKCPCRTCLVKVTCKNICPERSYKAKKYFLMANNVDTNKINLEGFYNEQKEIFER